MFNICKLPDIFNNQTPNYYNNPTIPYMHVGDSKPLHQEEEHNNKIRMDMKLNDIFYKRLHLVVRFSRNVLQHLEEKENSVKQKYLHLFVDNEEFKDVDNENEAIKSFSFYHPGLNWILPVFWEIHYRDYISKKIEEDQLKTWSVFKFK